MTNGVLSCLPFFYRGFWLSLEILVGNVFYVLVFLGGPVQ